MSRLLDVGGLDRMHPTVPMDAQADQKKAEVDALVVRSHSDAAAAARERQRQKSAEQRRGVCVGDLCGGVCARGSLRACVPVRGRQWDCVLVGVCPRQVGRHESRISGNQPCRWKRGRRKPAAWPVALCLGCALVLMASHVPMFACVLRMLQPLHTHSTSRHRQSRLKQVADSHSARRMRMAHCEERCLCLPPRRTSLGRRKTCRPAWPRGTNGGGCGS